MPLPYGVLQAAAQQCPASQQWSGATLLLHLGAVEVSGFTVCPVPDTEGVPTGMA